MQAKDEFAFSRSRAPLVFCSLVKPLEQGWKIDVEEEHAVEYVKEGIEVPATTAEEGHRLVATSGESLDLLYPPEVVLVPVAVGWCAGHGVALIGEFRIAVDGMVAASLQLLADGRLAASRHAFDKKVPSAH